LKAFYRLAERLKQRFPRLPICLLFDSLFAGGPTFSSCEQYHWKYLITVQDGDLPSVHQDFDALTQLAPEENQVRFTPSGYPPVSQTFRWMNDHAYVDSAQQPHRLAVLECLETKSLAGQPQTTRFQWVTILPTGIDYGFKKPKIW
jgi:hypothetical protein